MKVAPKYKKTLAVIVVLLSAFLTYHFGTDAEKAVQEADAIENIKEIAEEKVEEILAPKVDSAVVDSPAVEEVKSDGSLDGELDSLVKVIKEAQTE